VAFSEKHHEHEQQQVEEHAETYEDSGEESDGTTLSSEFAETADSGSLLDDVADPLTSSPLTNMPVIVHLTTSLRKDQNEPIYATRSSPPRPISVIQPVSALGSHQSEEKEA
jgi:hypothetical protein